MTKKSFKEIDPKEAFALFLKGDKDLFVDEGNNGFVPFTSEVFTFSKDTKFAKEKPVKISVGYRRYLFESETGKLYLLVNQEDEAFTPEAEPEFIRWLDTEYQYITAE